MDSPEENLTSEAINGKTIFEMMQSYADSANVLSARELMGKYAKEKNLPAHLMILPNCIWIGDRDENMNPSRIIKEKSGMEVEFDSQFQLFLLASDEPFEQLRAREMLAKYDWVALGFSVEGAAIADEDVGTYLSSADNRYDNLRHPFLKGDFVIDQIQSSGGELFRKTSWIPRLYRMAIDFAHYTRARDVYVAPLEGILHKSKKAPTDSIIGIYETTPLNMGFESLASGVLHLDMEGHLDVDLHVLEVGRLYA